MIQLHIEFDRDNQRFNVNITAHDGFGGVVSIGDLIVNEINIDKCDVDLLTVIE